MLNRRVATLALLIAGFVVTSATSPADPPSIAPDMRRGTIELTAENPRVELRHVMHARISLKGAGGALRYTFEQMSGEESGASMQLFLGGDDQPLSGAILGEALEIPVPASCTTPCAAEERVTVVIEATSPQALTAPMLLRWEAGARFTYRMDDSIPPQDVLTLDGDGTTAPFVDEPALDAGTGEPIVEPSAEGASDVEGESP